METAQMLDVGLLPAKAIDRGAWAALADGALLPAGLARPEFAEAAFAQHGNVRLACVSQNGRMLAALPVNGPESATSHLSNSGLPILDPYLGEAALAALLNHMNRPVLLTGVPADGPFADALARASTRHEVMRRWQRAALHLSGDYEQWFEANFDRKRRSRFRRNLRDLQGLAQFGYESLAPHSDVSPWAAAYLQLEAAGWKGQRGTALRHLPAAAQCFSEAAIALHKKGLLRFWRMTNEGRPIAMVMAIVERGAASFSKITFDENHARLSPGVMIILEATRSLFAEGNVRQIDSCAIPDHPMLDNIWRDRIAIADIMVAGANVSATTFNWAVAASHSKSAIRQRLRNALYWSKGWKPS